MFYTPPVPRPAGLTRERTEVEVAGSLSRDFNKSGVLVGEEGEVLTKENLEGLLSSSDVKHVL